jgi:hypothetical protein
LLSVSVTLSLRNGGRPIKEKNNGDRARRLTRRLKCGIYYEKGFNRLFYTG